jgi:hypothetical protein
LDDIVSSQYPYVYISKQAANKVVKKT